jgi:hypothetical protein
MRLNGKQQIYTVPNKNLSFNLPIEWQHSLLALADQGQSRARNNGRRVAGQSDRPTQFYLGHTEWLASQIIQLKAKPSKVYP